MRVLARHARVSRGITVIDLVVAVAVAVVAVAVLVSVLQKTRERARRAQCALNMKMIALACHQYASTLGFFPQGRSSQTYLDAAGDTVIGYHTGWSFHATMMPYLGQTAFFNACNFDLGPYQLRNHTVVGAMRSMLWCPNDPEIADLKGLIEERTAWDDLPIGVTYFNYAGLMGTFGFGRPVGDYAKQMNAHDGMFPDMGLPNAVGGPGVRPAITLGDVPDGFGNTLLLGERAHGKLSKFNCGPGGQCGFRGNGWWASSDYGDASITAFYSPNFTPNDLWGTHALGDPGSPTARCDGATPFAMSASSFHAGGCNFAFADGSVRFIKDTIESWDARSTAGFLDKDCIPSGSNPRGVYQAIATRSGGEAMTDGGY
jgi:prepilin-type processing-associated H-X9-DG protein